jgi:tagatose-1,6-bisphosphate aldolase
MIALGAPSGHVADVAMAGADVVAVVGASVFGASVVVAAEVVAAGVVAGWLVPDGVVGVAADDAAPSELQLETTSALTTARPGMKDLQRMVAPLR